MSLDRGWLAEEMARTSEDARKIPNSAALIRETAIQHEAANKQEAQSTSNVEPPTGFFYR